MSTALVTSLAPFCTRGKVFLRTSTSQIRERSRDTLPLCFGPKNARQGLHKRLKHKVFHPYPRKLQNIPGTTIQLIVWGTIEIPRSFFASLSWTREFCQPPSEYRMKLTDHIQSALRRPTATCLGLRGRKCQWAISPLWSENTKRTQKTEVNMLASTHAWTKWISSLCAAFHNCKQQPVF